MKHIFFLSAGIIFFALFPECSRNKKTSDACAFIIGADTISLVTVNRLVPDSMTLHWKILRAALELACVATVRNSPSMRPDSQLLGQIGRDLAGQLSRLSADQWTPIAGEKLYLAAKHLTIKQRELISSKRIAAYSDSLLSSMVAFCDSAAATDLRARTASAFNLSDTSDDSVVLESLFQHLFYLSKAASRIVREFAFTAESQSTKTVDAASAVRGIVSNGSPKTRVKKLRTFAASHEITTPKTSREALRFRNERSIKDSIEKHIPDLEALYKKHLKMHQNMEGVVWATFEISPAGEVLSAKIRTTAKMEKEFLLPFQDYLIRLIRFQKIPENLGNMVLEFPFDFSHEN
jgi:hypothetical protein